MIKFCAIFKIQANILLNDDKMNSCRFNNIRKNGLYHKIHIKNKISDPIVMKNYILVRLQIQKFVCTF